MSLLLHLIKCCYSKNNTKKSDAKEVENNENQSGGSNFYKTINWETESESEPELDEENTGYVPTHEWLDGENFAPYSAYMHLGETNY